MAIDLVAVLRLDDQMTQSLKSASMAATAGFAAITAAAAVSVKTFMDVEQELKRTAALTGATSSEFKALEQAAIDLGSSSSKGMQEISASMSELGASGMEVNEIIASMPGIIKASEASGESLATAAGVVSSALNIWGLEASEAGRVADILTMSANVSAAGIDSLGEALKYAGAPANALGMDLAEVSAAIGVMVDSGIDGSSAGTSLRAALLALNNPATAQGKIMDKLGFSITDAAGEAKSLVEIVENMTEATKHMTAADRLATVGKLVGTEAASGFLALMSKGPAKIAEMTDALRDSEGVATETANAMNDSLMASFNGFKSLIEATAYQIGDGLAPGVSRMLKLFQSIDFSPVIGAANAVGDAFAGIYDKIASQWSKIGPILKPIATAVGAMAASFMLIGGAGAIFFALSTAIGFISGPIAAVALGIGAVVGGLALLYDKVAPFRNKVTSMFDGLKVALGFEVNMPQAPKMAGDTGAMMLDEGNQAPQSVEYLSIAEQITKAFEKVKTAVAPVLTEVSNAFTQFKEFGGVAIDFLKAKFTEIQPSLAPLAAIFTQVWGTVSSVLTSAWSIISPILGGLWSLLQIVGEYSVIMFTNVLVPALGLASQAFSTVWSVASPILTGLALAFEVWMAVIKAVWENALAPFVNFLTTGVKNAFESLSEGLGEIAGAFDWVSDKVGGVYDRIRDFADTISNIKLPSWVTDGISTVVNTVGNFIGAGKGDKADGSHYNGLLRVSRDGYMASLHKDETVLPRFEADAYRSLLDSGMSLASLVSGAAMPGNALGSVAYDSSAGITNTYNTYNQNERAASEKPTQSGGGNNVTINKIADYLVIREEADIERVADLLTNRIIAAGEGGAGAWA